MPTQFTGNVDTPANMEFGANEFVDSSNSLEGLEEGAKALAATTGKFVERKLTNDILADAAAEESRYAEIRRTKKALYDAADNKDEEQVAKFSRQLEELTIAENQGAISGNNAGIRKETLLRSMINRFPHREEEIRQLYSSTRRQIAESRAAKVSDPVEEGINDVLQEAIKRGTTPQAVLEKRQYEDFMQRAATDAQYNAALGVDVAPQIEEAFDTKAMPIFYADAAEYVQRSMLLAQQSGTDVDAGTVKRALELMKQGARMRISSTINNILAASPEPGATLSQDFRKAQLDKVDQLYDGIIAQAENVDSLKAYARGLEHQKNKTIAELRKVDPMLRAMIDIGAAEYAAKYLAEDYPAVATVMFTQGRAGIEALLKNSPTAMERNRLKLQMHMLGDGYDPDQQAADVTNLIERGAPPEPTGDSYVDAIRLSGISDSVLKSSNTPPQAKDNAAVAILEAEKGESTYLSPGAHWFKNPTHLRQLRSSEATKSRMRDELVGQAAVVTRRLAEDPQLAASIVFAPDIERDQQQHKSPWKAYPNGGPFQSGQQVRRDDEAAQAEQYGLQSLADNKRSSNAILDALNNSYWIIRSIDGFAAAEDWAMEILGQRDADMGEGEGEGGGSEEELPTFDLTD